VSLYKLLLQAIAEELEAKIKECNSKGADYDLVSQKAIAAAGRRRATFNTPAGGRLFSIPSWITIRSEEENEIQLLKT
jgi:hypothetical protein